MPWLSLAKDDVPACLSLTHPRTGRSQPRHAAWTGAAAAQALEQGYQRGDAEVRVGPNYAVRLQEMNQYNENTGACA